MLAVSIQKYFNQFFRDKLNLQFFSLQFYSVGGGSINDTYQVRADNHPKFFLKINSVTKYPDLFQKEKTGLELLCQQKIIQVPVIIGTGEIDGFQFLLLEWIEGGIKSEKFWESFGEQLAALHHVTNSYFGFEEDNYMGALPQINHQQTNWIEFFIHCRLQPQIDLGKQKHLLQAKHVGAFENLYQYLPTIFENKASSLLHGDLWSGNYMCNLDSKPVLIDPAVYFGHRSMDLAMTTLFGGFDKIFYESYNYHFPFPKNYHEQWEVCNLYPLLIHLNLFGSGYLSQIESVLKKFR
jgi:fructosamine-3-kinase